jgi:Domain of unknown function (DUF4116)
MSDLRSRLSKILELHGEALAEAVGQREPNSQEAQLPTKDLILRFADMDPTDGKSRTQWLVKTYIQDGQFKLEDLGRVDAALAAFERFKRKLPVEQRELSRLTSFRDLEALVDPFVKAEERARLTRDLSTATGREKRRLEELKARDESIIIQEAEGLPTIAVPMTEFASKWWGRGTKWCTAADKDNAFTQYHKHAPLVIIVCPDGEKFQANVTSDMFQFMDNTDKDISEKTIRERWNEFQSLLYWAIEQNGLVLQDVPEKHRTEELCRIALKQDGRALRYVPKAYRTPELCRLAVEQNGLALTCVPENLRTPELYRLAVEQDGWALEDIPENQRTLELCRIAVQSNGRVLGYVPAEYKAELYSLALEQNGKALKYIDKDYRTAELCLLAVQQDGRILEYVPYKHQTPELCCLAIEQNGLALQFVPEKYKTEKLCRLAIEQNGQALRYVPQKYHTTEFYYLAIEQNGLALQELPEDHKTPELCRLAVEQNREALKFVPEEFKIPELMALIPPSQPKWHPDILQGLCTHSQPYHESVCPVSL